MSVIFAVEVRGSRIKMELERRTLVRFELAGTEEKLLGVEREEGGERLGDFGLDRMSETFGMKDGAERGGQVLERPLTANKDEKDSVEEERIKAQRERDRRGEEGDLVQGGSEGPREFPQGKRKRRGKEGLQREWLTDI